MQIETKDFLNIRKTNVNNNKRGLDVDETLNGVKKLRNGNVNECFLSPASSTSSSSSSLSKAANAAHCLNGENLSIKRNEDENQQNNNDDECDEQGDETKLIQSSSKKPSPLKRPYLKFSMDAILGKSHTTLISNSTSSSTPTSSASSSSSSSSSDYSYHVSPNSTPNKKLCLGIYISLI